MRIGIDLGGSKIEGIALDDQGRRLVQHRLPTPAGDYQATLDTILQLIQSIEAESGTRGTVGIGTPGSPSPASGLMRNANSTCLNGKPLQRDLERRLARTIRLANDADCFALSEARDGAGAGVNSLFAVIIGTGTGAGVVINGRLLTGANRIAGEWGHNPLPWPSQHELPGERCYCGLQGCIETFLSGPALEREYYQITGDHCSAKGLADRLKGHEATAEQVFRTYEDRLARSLASVINIIDPEVIVLGGGLSNFERLYQTIPTLWSDYIFSDVVNTRLLPPVHGDASGVRGAAWLWED